MIRGAKPNGYTVAYDREGRKIEAETRACVHCQFNWGYGDPHFPEELDSLLGHPTRRGWCVHCGGWLCGRQACIVQQNELVERHLHATGKIRSCMPFEEWANRLSDRFGGRSVDPGLRITGSGLLLRDGPL